MEIYEKKPSVARHRTEAYATVVIWLVCCARLLWPIVSSGVLETRNTRLPVGSLVPRILVGGVGPSAQYWLASLSLAEPWLSAIVPGSRPSANTGCLGVSWEAPARPAAVVIKTIVAGS